jgi:hypothetical protein
MSEEPWFDLLKYEEIQLCSIASGDITETLQTLIKWVKANLSLSANRL